MRNLVCGLALLGHIRPDATEAHKAAVVSMARRGGQFPPTLHAFGQYWYDQVAKGLTPLETIGQLVQFGGILTLLPRIAGNQLKQGLPLHRLRVCAKCIRKARGHLRGATRHIGLPQPVRATVFKFPQEKANRLRFFLQYAAGDLV